MKPKTIFEERFTVSEAIDTCQMLASGSTFFNQLYPYSRGKKGNPLILEVLWATGCIAKEPVTNRWMAKEDTQERAHIAAKVLWAKFWRGMAEGKQGQKTINGKQIVKI